MHDSEEFFDIVCCKLSCDLAQCLMPMHVEIIVNQCSTVHCCPYRLCKVTHNQKCIFSQL